MIEKTYDTPCGTIHYWVNGGAECLDIKKKACENPVTGNYGVQQDKEAQPQLVFLPGLTADHRLFMKQIRYFEKKYPIFVWDAPGHAASWPFELSFNLMDKARWLDEILIKEGFDNPVIIGQSMGGYVGQTYAQLFPDKLRGFISIDSAPLQREYVTRIEIWLLKRMEPVYRHYPWNALLKSGTKGVAQTPYGRKLMLKMMMTYDGDQERYAKLSGHGFRILAEAYEADLPYKITCPALIICGDKDHAGSCIRYNKAWHKKSGIPIKWIKNAGHNSNTDNPEKINYLIEKLITEQISLR
jgi:pimeloyl-ACP methyl ester carboxylesterase